MKILICDLDGTTRQTKSGKKFINQPDDQEIIPGAYKAIEKVFREWMVIGCTNQGGVAAGHKTIESCVAEQRKTLELLTHFEPMMEMIIFCPDWGDRYGIVYNDNKPFLDGSKELILKKEVNFRKPETGMIEVARRTFRHSTITEMLFVGDMDSDKECAEKADIPFIWAKDWWIND